MAGREKSNQGFISVIIPVYKQEATIENDLLRIKRVLDQLRYDYEMIVVIDGYLDNSLQNARKVKCPSILITGYQHNHGKGNAVRFGMAKAKGNIIAFIDAGMDLNPNGLSMLLEYFEWYDADIVVGSKRHPVSKVNYPFQRKMLSWGYRMLTHLLFGLSVHDTQVGMKIFRRKVLEDVLPRLLIKTYAFDIEILAISYYLGYTRIYEAPVELNFKKGSIGELASINILRIILRMLWDTFAVFYRLKIQRYYDNSNKRKWQYDPELNFKVNIG